VATDAGGVPNELTQAQREKILKNAEDWAGTPYSMLGARSQKNVGGDCSGSTWLIYKSSGVNYDYVMSSDIPTSPNFKQITTPQIGDVVQWPKTTNDPGHVAIYAGQNAKGDAMIWTTSSKGYTKMRYTDFKNARTRQDDGTWYTYKK
jgi:cell wall-associated NlpC family hydrolase